MKKLLFIITVSICSTIQSQNWLNLQKIDGNGNFTTKKVNTEIYDVINVGGDYNVTLVKGKEGSISIEAESNLMEYITVKVKGNSLELGIEKGIKFDSNTKIKITVPVEKISDLNLAGSGKITSATILNSKSININLAGSGVVDLSISANTIFANIGGSGDILIKGKCKELNCSIAGSGDIDAYGLQADEVIASISGSGNVKTSVKNKITAAIVGSGNVYYKGESAKITIKSIGSGKVVSKN